MENINTNVSQKYLSEESFREDLAKLNVIDSLSIDSQGNFVPGRPVSLFNKLFQQNATSSNPRLVEFKIMELLIEGKKWLKLNDMQLVEQLVHKAGLTLDQINSKNNHRELWLLVHLISREVLHQEYIPHDDLTYLCKAFRTHYRTTLSPHANLCEQIIQKIANISPQLNEMTFPSISEEAPLISIKQDEPTFAAQESQPEVKDILEKPIDLTKKNVTKSIVNAGNENKRMIAKLALGAIAASMIASGVYYSCCNGNPQGIPKHVFTPSAPASTDYTGLFMGLILGCGLLYRVFESNKTENDRLENCDQPKGYHKDSEHIEQPIDEEGNPKTIAQANDDSKNSNEIGQPQGNSKNLDEIEQPQGDERVVDPLEDDKTNNKYSICPNFLLHQDFIKNKEKSPQELLKAFSFKELYFLYHYPNSKAENITGFKILEECYKTVEKDWLLVFDTISNFKSLVKAELSLKNNERFKDKNKNPSRIEKSTKLTSGVRTKKRPISNEGTYNLDLEKSTVFAIDC